MRSSFTLFLVLLFAAVGPALTAAQPSADGSLQEELAHAQAFIQQERWQDALRAYQRVERLFRRRESSSEGVPIEQVRVRIGQLHRIVGQAHVQSDRLGQALHHFKEARTALPDSAAVHTGLAALHLQKQNWRAAEKAAQRGLKRFPEHAPLLRTRAEALSRLEEMETLVSVLRRLYRLQPGDIDVGIAYGRALAASGQPAEAQALFEDLLEDHPRKTEIYDALVAVNEQQLNYEGVLNVLQRRRQQFPEDPNLSLRVGRLHEQLGDYEAARTVYDSTQAIADSGDVTPLLERARTFIEQDSLDGALDAYRGLLNRAPGHGDALRGLGRVLEQRANWSEALDVYRRLRDSDGEAAYAHFKLGQVYEELDRTDRALRAYRTAVDKGADHPLAHFRYAVLLHAQSDDEAFTAAKRALRRSLRAVERLQRRQLQQLQRSTRSAVSANDPQAKKERLKAYGQVAEEAFAFLAGTFSPEQTEPVIADLLDEYETAGRLHYWVGLYYQRRGEQSQALHHLKRAVREAPDLRVAHLSLGALYEERGNFRNAVRSYERARTLDERAPDAYRALLALYRKQGQLDVLIQRWQARYRSDPQNHVLREHLVEALHKTERYEDAQGILKAAEDSTL